MFWAGQNGIKEGWRGVGQVKMEKNVGGGVGSRCTRKRGRRMVAGQNGMRKNMGVEQVETYKEESVDGGARGCGVSIRYAENKLRGSKQAHAFL